MNRLMVLLVASVCAGPMLADDWALRDSDRLLDAGEVQSLTAGQTLVFFDDGRSSYGPGDAYSWTYASGQTAIGHYRIRSDGTICIDYLNGFSRCDRYVENGGRIVLLTEDGQRFPVRPAEKQ